MDPVVLVVGLFRVAGSLLVLRWPFWGGVAAVLCDLLDLLLFDLSVPYAGWAGFDGYQSFDKWADQVYLAAFLSWRCGTSTVAAGGGGRRCGLFRFVGFVGFEAGLAAARGADRSSRTCSSPGSSPSRSAPVRAGVPVDRRGGAAGARGLLGVKLVQEWALHVGRLFDSMSFLGRRSDRSGSRLTAPFELIGARAARRR